VLPEQTSVLLSLAQLGVAFAGFAAIVVLFGRGEGGRWKGRHHVDRFHGMIVHALVAVFFCMLPLVIDAFTTRADAIWRIASALLGVEILVHSTGVMLMPSTIGLRARVTVAIGYLIAVVQFMNAAAYEFERPFEAYLVGVVWHVFMSGALFLMLIWVTRADVDAA
jgi:hypothetical protein